MTGHRTRDSGRGTPRGGGPRGFRDASTAAYAVAACLAAAPPGAAHASDSALEILPLRIANQNPLVQIHGLPAGESAALLPPGTARAELAFDVANLYTSDASASEELEYDGETHRLTLRYRRGIGSGWQVGADLPFVAHDGGFLDGFIYNWHDFFGLPQHGRERSDDGLLAITYARDGATRIDLRTRQSGVGDLRLLAGYPLSSPGDRMTTAAHASLSLPTGDAGSLLGSGAVELALWGSGRISFGPHADWAAYGSAGALWMDQGEVLPELQRSLAGFASLGLGWRPADWITLQLQLDGHTALYDDTELSPLGPALQFTMGGSLRLAPRLRLDLAVVEDATIGRAPDIGLHLNLRWDH